MTGAITTMQRQLNRHVGVCEVPERHIRPPRPIPDKGEDPHEEDREDRETSMRRSRSLRY